MQEERKQSWCRLVSGFIIFPSTLVFEAYQNKVLWATQLSLLSSWLTVIIVARSVAGLIPIVMQLIFCFALMDEQAYLPQHKILIIF